MDAYSYDTPSLSKIIIMKSIEEGKWIEITPENDATANGMTSYIVVYL